MSQVLYALDPGTEQSALVSCVEGAIAGRVFENHELLDVLLRSHPAPAHLIVEEVQSYGMPVGREVFQTVFWSGRFVQAWGRYPDHELTWSLLPRKDVKLTLCGSARAKDANVRQALLDRFGGKQKAVGTKKAPGPLYGIKSHCWSALALAITYQEQINGIRRNEEHHRRTSGAAVPPDRGTGASASDEG